jgi:hypothetical protein
MMAGRSLQAAFREGSNNDSFRRFTHPSTKRRFLQDRDLSFQAADPVCEIGWHFRFTWRGDRSPIHGRAIGNSRLVSWR